MVSSLNQTVQNVGKCPHGFPIGACPICSGMAGGKKERDIPRKAGEMSYNECMAEWMKMLAMKDAKLQAKEAKINAVNTIQLHEKIQNFSDKLQNAVNNFMQKVESLPNIVKLPISIVVNVIVRPILNLISKIPAMVQKAQTFIQNISQSITNFITSTGEKLASIFGEIKNFVVSTFSNNFKKRLKTILSLFTENTDEDDENKEIEKLKSKKLKNVLKGLFRIRTKAKEEKDEESLV